MGNMCCTDRRLNKNISITPPAGPDIKLKPNKSEYNDQALRPRRKTKLSVFNDFPSHSPTENFIINLSQAIWI